MITSLLWDIALNATIPAALFFLAKHFQGGGGFREPAQYTPFIQPESETVAFIRFAGSQVAAATRYTGNRIDLVKDALDGLGKGYSVVEIDWARGAQWLPRKYDWRDPRFFQTDRVSQREIRLPGLETSALEIYVAKGVKRIPGSQAINGVNWPGCVPTLRDALDLWEEQASQQDPSKTSGVIYILDNGVYDEKLTIRLVSGTRRLSSGLSGGSGAGRVPRPRRRHLPEHAPPDRALA